MKIIVDKIPATPRECLFSYPVKWSNCEPGYRCNLNGGSCKRETKSYDIGDRHHSYHWCPYLEARS